MTSQIRLEKSWKDVLKDEFEKSYFKELTSFVKEEYMKSKIFPPTKRYL